MNNKKIIGSNLTAFQVAHFFISKGIESNNPVSLLKILKLLYIAQGTYLAMKEEPLFEDNIEAWEHGPVVPVIYAAFKAYGNVPIMDKSFKDVSCKLKSDSYVMSVLNLVWNTFGGWTGIMLSNWVNKPGSPWSNITNQKNLQKNNIRISHNLMRDYFKGLLVNK